MTDGTSSDAMLINTFTMLTERLTTVEDNRLDFSSNFKWHLSMDKLGLIDTSPIGELPFSVYLQHREDKPLLSYNENDLCYLVYVHKLSDEGNHHIQDFDMFCNKQFQKEKFKDVSVIGTLFSDSPKFNSIPWLSKKDDKYNDSYAIMCFTPKKWTRDIKDLILEVDRLIQLYTDEHRIMVRTVPWISIYECLKHPFDILHEYQRHTSYDYGYFDNAIYCCPWDKVVKYCYRTADDQVTYLRDFTDRRWLMTYIETHPLLQYVPSKGHTLLNVEHANWHDHDECLSNDELVRRYNEYYNNDDVGDVGNVGGE